MMSFVSVIATKDYLTVMSDGRVVGGSGEVLREDYRKFIKVEEGESFVAYAGDRTVCETVSEIVKNAIEKGFSYEEVQSIVKQSVNETFKNTRTLMIAFGGWSVKWGFEILTYNSLDDSEQHLKMLNKDILYVFLEGSGLLDLEDKLVECLRASGGYDTPSKAIQAQKLLNTYVATIDNTVNNNTYKMVIKN